MESKGHYVIQDVRGLKKSQNGKGWKLSPHSYTVDTLATQGVLVTPRSTNMQLKHTKGILNMKTSETQQTSKQPTSQILTLLSEDSLANLLVLLESGEDLATPEALSSLTSLGFSSTKDPDIFYSKTSKVYLVMTAAKLSRQYLGFLPTWGTELNGRFLTAKTSEFPNTESGCSLSDILQEDVDEKYFLSTGSEWVARIQRSRLRREDMGHKGTALMLTYTPKKAD